MPKVSEAYLESRRQHILEAAVACFARSGFHQTTTDDICQEADISPGALYGYFSNKEEIIRAVAALETQDGKMVDLVKEVSANEDPFNSLSTLLRYWFARLERPEMDRALRVRVRSWAEALQNPDVEDDVLARWQDRLATGEEWIRKGQERGEINPDLDSHAGARALQAVMDGFVLQWTIDPEVDIWKFLEVVLAMFGGSFWQGEFKT
jgi:AcrR family transcriptional regulator